jgi:hypothetical protein
MHAIRAMFSKENRRETILNFVRYLSIGILLSGIIGAASAFVAGSEVLAFAGVLIVAVGYGGMLYADYLSFCIEEEKRKVDD